MGSYLVIRLEKGWGKFHACGTPKHLLEQIRSMMVFSDAVRPPLLDRQYLKYH